MRFPSCVLPIVVATLTVACSSSSGGGSPQDASACDAMACQAIEASIVSNGGNAGTCVNPPPKFVAACQSYEDCLRACE